jgi:hypothetical protein
LPRMPVRAMVRMACPFSSEVNTHGRYIPRGILHV